MAKPSQLPRWASGGSAQVTPEPTESKKDLGWVAGEKPPNNYFNWVLKVIYQWCQYLDGLTNEALTWAAAHVFNSTVTVTTAPTASTHVARKNEVDAEATARANADSSEATARANTDALKANLSGTDFTGAVTVQVPTAAAHAARKDYVDAFKPQFAKAWGKLLCGASGAVTIVNGVNISSASWSASRINVTLSINPGADGCGVSNFCAGYASPYQSSIGVNGIGIVLDKSLGSSWTNWASNDAVYFVVYGS